ncbi:MAG: DUF917 domain-containing protein [Spirochaetales bacterium]|nr:DUF917 domain-containing protein [Spirochaetales bacterium]
MRLLDEQAIEHIALGASLLGTGGGGDPHVGKLMALNAIRKHGPVKLVSPSELPDDALIVPSAMMGAPIVIIEKIPNGQEFITAFQGLEGILNKKVYATIPIEAGGVNSMIPIAVAAQLGIPLVDADGMGRAFPELQMVTYHLDGIPASPMVIVDEKGNRVILNTITNNWAEEIARVCTVTMGASVMISLYSMTGRQVKDSGISGIMTFSELIGKAITNARKTNTDPLEDLLDITKGYKLFQGKITDVSRNISGGFNRGLCAISGLDEYTEQSMEIAFQNENLIASKDGTVVASVPDLICIIDVDTLIPVTTETLKFGRRVVVLGIPCVSKWRTPKGIETVGPRYFGYDIDYTPIEKLAAKQEG